MKPHQVRQTNWIKRQNQLFKTFKDTAGLNFCSSLITQKVRFSALLSIGDIHRKSILDVGCGTGELCRHTDKRYYTGWDLNSKLIKLAHHRHPGYNFTIQNLEDYQEKTTWDYVFASGLFQWQDPSQPFYYKSLLRKMFSLCKIGIAFNMLSFYRDPEYKYSGELYPKPENIFKFAMTLSHRVNLLHSYHPGDFTIHILK